MDHNDSFSSTVAATNSNLTRLSKTVASTATSLMSSSYGDLSNTHYQKAMNDIARRPTFQRRLFSFNKRTPSELVKSSLSKSEIEYRAVTSIPEELLYAIPESDGNKFSLYQGFRALEEDRKAEQEEEEMVRELEAQGGNTRVNRLLEGGIGSMNKKTLTKEKRRISHRLDLLEVRKDLAANEIKEIDERIERLNAMRIIVFERVANLEQEEMQLENQLQTINERLGEIEESSLLTESEEDDEREKESDLANDKNAKENDGGKVNASGNIKNIKESGVYDEGGDGLKSDKMPENPLDSTIHIHRASSTSSDKREKRIRRRSFSSRKTTPTLQQYYAPGKNIRTIRAHSDAITCLDFDIPFGTMVSACVDDSVTVWDLSRGEAIGSLEGHKASVQCMKMEQNIIATGSADATIMLWDLAAESPSEYHVETFVSHLAEVTALHFDNDSLVSGSEDRTIRQWDLHSGRCIQTLDVLWTSAHSGLLRMDGNRNTNLTTAGAAVTAGGRSLKAPFVAALQCYDAALASGTSDGVVRLWDLRSGQVVRTLVGHTGPVSCLQFDDIHLATGSFDRSIRIWDLRTGSLYDAFAYEAPIRSLHFDARRIVSANGQNTVKIYDRAEERHWTVGPGDENGVEINHVKYREGYLVEGRQDGQVGVWAC